MNEDRILIEITSPDEYDDLIAEIWVDGKLVGIISREEGDDRPVFELVGNFDSKIELEVFREALDRAMTRLEALGPKLS